MFVLKPALPVGFARSVVLVVVLLLAPPAVNPVEVATASVSLMQMCLKWKMRVLLRSLFQVFARHCRIVRRLCVFLLRKALRFPCNPTPETLCDVTCSFCAPNA